MHAFLSTYVFILPLLVLLLAEATKVLIEMIHDRTWHEKLFQPGGMPSTHSAFVTSLVMIVARRDGMESTAFAIAFVFACVMWYDAMSSRKAIGDQAKILNRLQHWEHFKERLGHSFAEVAAGIGFGALVTGIGLGLL